MWVARSLNRLRPASVRAFLSATALAVVVFVGYQAGVLVSLEHRLDDVRFSLWKRPATEALLLVQIDPESISELGTWPWPRRIHASIVDRLRTLGAADIAFDVDFSSPSTSVEDAAFAAALRRASGSVILPAFQQTTHDERGTISASARFPLPAFAEQSWIASVNVVADRDGRIRGVPLADPIGGQDVPVLAGMLAGNTFSEPNLKIDFGIDPATLDRVSVADLLDGKVAPERVRGRKVIIGASAVELRDFVLVPVHGFITGAMFHALAAETLLQHRALGSPPEGTTTLAFIVAALLGGLLLARTGWLWSLATLGGAALATEAVAFCVYVNGAVLLDTAPFLALFAGLAAVAVVQEVDLSKINLWLARTEAGNLKAVLGQVVHDNFDGIIVADEHGLIEAASAKAADILDLAPEMLRQGADMRSCLPRQFSDALIEAMDLFRRDAWSPVTREFTFPRSASDARVLEYVVTPSKLKRKGSTWRRSLVTRHISCLTFRDITEERRLEREAYRLAHFSALTGLPNRHALQEKLRDLLAGDNGAASFALMVLDIDRFQSINATLGQDYGDMLIGAVASRLSGLSRNIQYAAHLGGDDFAVVLGGWSSRQELEEIADLLLVAMGQPYGMDIRRLQLSFSAGAVVCGPHVKDAVAALIMADNALLIAKQWGGGVCKFHEEVLASNISDLQALELDLWTAFGKGQFYLVYQPQFDVQNGSIIGAEALLRWDHPSRGRISPAEFIPLAELTGLISSLGNWALEKACTDARKWPDSVRLAVNVSVQQLRRSHYREDVERVLERTGLPPGRLELEVTESVFIKDSLNALDVLRALRSRGIHLSLDDFGTGYSSLSYVSSFPFDKVKIDRSFVHQLKESETARAIIKTIISLTQHIGIGVIAEGIETLEQANALRLMGCREAQGFYFAEPQSADAMTALIARHAANSEALPRSA